MAKSSSKLTPKKIIKTALAQIEQKGLAKFSMRALAGKLRIEPMSLYHYFPSREELLNSIHDSILGEVVFLDKEKPWKERLRWATAEWRKLAIKYPNFHHYVALHRMNTTPSIEFLNSLMEIFVDTGLASDRAADYFRVLSFFITGASLDAITRFSTGPSASNPISDAEFKERFPIVRNFTLRWTPEQEKKIFEMGLELFMSALESEIKKTAAPL